MTDDTVPFGKYRGKPVEDMLADTDYMAWLEGQPWFRARFAHLLARRDVEAANRTPVHNRLQALFLDPTYAMAFVRVAPPRHLGRIEEQKRRSSLESEAKTLAFAAALRKSAIQQRERAEDAIRSAEKLEAGGKPSFFTADEYRRSAAEYETKAVGHETEADALPLAIVAAQNAEATHCVTATFEDEGADVLLSVRMEWQAVLGPWDAAVSSPRLCKVGESFSLSLEIKPTVADEYPAILRQMKRNKSSYLFVGAYEGHGATEAQFVAIFAASGKHVVFKRDVDAEAARLREGA